MTQSLSEPLAFRKPVSGVLCCCKDTHTLKRSKRNRRFCLNAVAWPFQRQHETPSLPATSGKGSEKFHESESGGRFPFWNTHTKNRRSMKRRPVTVEGPCDLQPELGAVAMPPSSRCGRSRVPGLQAAVPPVGFLKEVVKWGFEREVGVCQVADMGWRPGAFARGVTRRSRSSSQVRTRGQQGEA